MNDKKEIDWLISVLTLGLVSALKKESINIDDAHMILFSPRVMSLLEKKGFNQTLIDIIHLGTELEDIKDNFHNKYDYYCNDLLERVHENLVGKNLSEPPHIIEELIKKTSHTY